MSRLIIVGNPGANITAALAAAALEHGIEIKVAQDDEYLPPEERDKRLVKKAEAYLISSASRAFTQPYIEKPKSNEPFYRNLPKYRKRR